MIHRKRLTRRHAGCLPDYGEGQIARSCAGDRFRHTAYHEAGHVVLYALFDRTIFGAKIGGVGDTVGVTYPNWGYHFHVEDRVERLKYVMIFMAGRLAELQGQCRERILSDFSAEADEEIEDRELKAYGKGATAAIPRLKMHTRGLLAKHRLVVRRVADALMCNGTIGVNRPMKPLLRGLKTYGRPKQ
jgi:hypothetical protein